jgi:hypothetical protein
MIPCLAVLEPAGLPSSRLTTAFAAVAFDSGPSHAWVPAPAIAQMAFTRLEGHISGPSPLMKELIDAWLGQTIASGRW